MSITNNYGITSYYGSGSKIPINNPNRTYSKNSSVYDNTGGYRSTHLGKMLNAREQYEIAEWRRDILATRVPNKLPSACHNNKNYIKHREEMEYEEILDNNELYIYNLIPVASPVAVAASWLFPLAEGINKTGKKVLEINAKSGMISSCLMSHGLFNQVVGVTDSGRSFYDIKKFWCSVEELDYRAALEKYIDDVGFVILSLPPHDDTALNVLQRIRRHKSDATLIYIGDTLGGNNAPEEFFERAQRIRYKDLSLHFKLAHDKYIGYNDDKLVFYK